MTNDPEMTATSEPVALECPAPIAAGQTGSLGLAPGSASVHFSSASDDWPTPQDFFDKCNAEFGPFDLDVAAAPDNAKCAKYFTSWDDGLAREWCGRVWMNPPYGRTIGDWMRKAYESAQAGALVVCLVPARTDTAWWHDYAIKGHIRFIRGRLKFGGHENSAPFPSALVVFSPLNAEIRHANPNTNSAPSGQ